MAEKYTTNPNEPKDAIVMSSGGAEGAYSVGVIKALFTGQSPVTGYRPLDPAIFTGSSIGAFNASFLVSRLGETDIASPSQTWSRSGWKTFTKILHCTKTACTDFGPTFPPSSISASFFPTPLSPLSIWPKTRRFCLKKP